MIPSRRPTEAAWRLAAASPARVARVPELSAGNAVRAGLGAPESSEARSHEIGWFDLSARETAPASGRGFGDADGSADTRPDPVLLRLAALLQPPLALFCRPGGILEWPAPLLPYQREGVATLLSQRQLLLADDMGLGKTVQAIAALRILFYRRRITSALIVCPASLVVQWRGELRRWAPELTAAPIAGPPGERAGLWRLPAHIRLIGYETLRADVESARVHSALSAPWGVVILDEASRIKNRETGIAHACKRLPRLRRWALTGTPLENSEEDLVSLFEFLTGEPGERPRPWQTAGGVRAELRKVQLRRKKEDVLHDLPPRVSREIALELGSRQRAAYEQAEQSGIVRLREGGPAVTITHVLELITRLKQICNADPETGESAKLDDINARMETLVAEGHRALVFSQFTDETFGIAKAASALAAFHPLTFTGEMSAPRRAETVDRFTRDIRHKALLLSLRAGGVGLNLQAASYVFHLDRWWNPAIEEQADSRAHRMGQIFPVTAFRYTCAATIEERIAETLRAKRRLFAEIVDDVSLELSTTLSEAEMFGLFGLSPPRAARATQHAKSSAENPTEAAGQPLSGEDFEEWVAEGLARAGFRVQRTPPTRDGGVDVVAVRTDAIGLETRLLVQCKGGVYPAGIAAARELRGATLDRTVGTIPILACIAGFTADARAFAAANGLILWGEAELAQLHGETASKAP